MSNDLSILFINKSTDCSVTENWCVRSCPALPAAKVLSVSKSIFTIPAIRITIDFSNTTFLNQIPVFLRHSVPFQRHNTLLSRAQRCPLALL
jgi:hypothetical protein